MQGEQGTLGKVALPRDGARWASLPYLWLLYPWLPYLWLPYLDQGGKLMGVAFDSEFSRLFWGGKADCNAAEIEDAIRAEEALRDAIFCDSRIAPCVGVGETCATEHEQMFGNAVHVHADGIRELRCRKGGTVGKEFHRFKARRMGQSGQGGHRVQRGFGHSDGNNENFDWVQARPRKDLSATQGDFL